MKKIIYLIIALGGIAGCSQQEPEGHYEEQNRLYFVYPEYSTILETYVADSIVFSFGMMPDEVTQGVAKIPVKLMGRVVDEVRKYRVTIADTGIYVKGRTTMRAGVHYEAFSAEQDFAAHVYEDTLEVIVYKAALDPSFTKKKSECMVLRLEDALDFGVGAVEQSEIKLVVNNYLAEPVWWAQYAGYLKYYHPVKWRKLMEYDEEFKRTDKLGFSLPDVQQYAGWLETYLGQNVIIDEETGKRVLMDELIAVEP